jgi:hypothetical protein
VTEAKKFLQEIDKAILLGNSDSGRGENIDLERPHPVHGWLRTK